MSEIGKTVLWRRLDDSGHEFARLFRDGATWRLSGTAVFTHETKPCCLGYEVVCDSGWRTMSGRVSGWVENEVVDVDIVAQGDGRWFINRRECPAVFGCLDLDLNFSPVTNTLPLRRLQLKLNQRATVTAAWLKFPSFRLEPLEQVYERTANLAYHYESAGGSFTADIEVDEFGLVRHYPNGWALANSTGSEAGRDST